MQAPTHFLFGILTYKLLYLFVPSNLDTFGLVVFNIIAFIIIFLSHFIVDAFAKITYHVPDARPEDKFWLTYHIGIGIFTLILLIIYMKEFYIAIIASVGFDLIDWVVVRAILKKKEIIHPFIEDFRDTYLKWLPDLLEKKYTVIFEIIVDLILIIFIYIL